MIDERLREHVLGAVYGAAIGDALGSAFEFVESPEIHREIGSSVAREYREALRGSLMYPRPPAVPTDDTAMALALVHALSAGNPTPEHIAQQFQALLTRDGRFGPMFWDGGPGGACVRMLNVLDDGAQPFERISGDAGGNGAAMRAYPCAVFREPERVAEISAIQARLSHGHAAAVAAAQAIALAVHGALYEGTLRTSMSALVHDPMMAEAWSAAHRDLPSEPPLPTHLLDVDMAGWRTAAAAHAIAKAFESDPETAIGIAAASGRDTDTVATIVGALVGALNGYDALPRRWVEGLAIRDDLDEAAALLCDIAARNEE